jgi:hypothetical protein
MPYAYLSCPHACRLSATHPNVITLTTQLIIRFSEYAFVVKAEAFQAFINFTAAAREKDVT